MSFMNAINRIGALLLPLVLVGVLAASTPSHSYMYTFDGDFDVGTMTNVNHDSPNNDQLQLNSITEPFPFINVAASARGTMVRINTDTGAIIGEYRTAPEGMELSPSRTTVDLDGNVWTGNRSEAGFLIGVRHGSVVKIGLVVGGTRVDADSTVNPTGEYLAPPFDYNTCVDGDDDGLIKTSAGLGDIRPWLDITDGDGGTDGLVEDADDECILIYQRLADALHIRHVSVDANNDVWVGGYTGKMFYKLDESTGTVLDSFDATCGGYGGLIDGNGILWSAGFSSGLLRYDPGDPTTPPSCILVYPSYGLGLDTNGYIWNSMWSYNSIIKIDPLGSPVAGFPKSTSGALNDRGVAVTPADNHVWVANSGGADVSRLDNDGNPIKVISLGADGLTPTGVAVDANGKVWVTCLTSNTVKRIDPNGGAEGLGAVDLTVNLGPGAGPYNYSDMTGIVVLSAVQQGTWDVVHDSGMAGATGCMVSWNGEPAGNEPAGTSITVEARAADNQANLAAETFVSVTNGSDAGVTGRYVEVKATLARDSGLFDTPVLSDLTVICNQAPTANANGSYLGPAGAPICFDGIGSTDPDGDALNYSWDFGDSTSMGTGSTPCHTYAEAGIYDVCLTVDDGYLMDTDCTYVVVYDPSAGFVTGGGWIYSPPGAYMPDQLLEGKATFGFVSKYKKGDNVPTGQTEFQFQAGSLNLHSDSYEFLVVTQGGTRAQFKGVGTINGEYDSYGSLYKFMIWATDDEPDAFRIKIWEEDSVGTETVVYDNGVDQPISGGSIVIHAK